jgi:excisionase family DNA binding protein
MSEDKEFFSTTDLSRTLGVSRTAVFKKIKAGKIIAQKVGRNYVIPKSEFASALGQFVPERKKGDIEKTVKRIVREYEETLRLLGKE